MIKAISHGICLVVVLFCTSLSAQDRPEIKLTAVTPELQAAAQSALKGISHSTKTASEGINKNGVYAITGNIFGDGHCRAVLDIKGTVVLCSWEKDRWDASVYFENFSAEWLFPGWNRDLSEGYKPVSEKPFWTLRLQGHSLLAVATEADKYAQDYDVFLLDDACRRVVAHADSYRLAPEIRCDHLVTEDGSRRKAIWGAQYYSRIEGGKIVVKKSWGEYVPYNESEETPDYYYASHNGDGYVILWGDNDEKGSSECVIYKKNLPMRLEMIPKPGREEKIYAKVFLTGKHGENFNADPSLGSSDIPEGTLAYLFEKLTGLPRKLYRQDSESRQPKALESCAIIRIVGEPEAVKILSPKISKR